MCSIVSFYAGLYYVSIAIMCRLETLDVRGLEVCVWHPSQSYGASSAIWGHTVLPATRCRWTCPALTPAIQVVVDLPTPEGWKAELTLRCVFWSSVYVCVHMSIMHNAREHLSIMWLNCNIDGVWGRIFTRSLSCDNDYLFTCQDQKFRG